MCSSVGDRTCLLPGFPIRKSSDQRSVDSSPRLIAASYVLHRLLVPRHPPCALKNLATQKSHPSTPGRTSMSGPTQTLLLQSQKMLASTVQFSTYDQTPATRPRQTQTHPTGQLVVRDADRPCREETIPHPVTRAWSALSGPNSVPTAGVTPATPFPTPPEGNAVLGAAAAAGRTGQ